MRTSFGMEPLVGALHGGGLLAQIWYLCGTLILDDA